MRRLQRDGPERAPYRGFSRRATTFAILGATRKRHCGGTRAATVFDADNRSEDQAHTPPASPRAPLHMVVAGRLGPPVNGSASTTRTVAANARRRCRFISVCLSSGVTGTRGWARSRQAPLPSPHVPFRSLLECSLAGRHAEDVRLAVMLEHRGGLLLVHLHPARRILFRRALIRYRPPRRPRRSSPAPLRPPLPVPEPSSWRVPRARVKVSSSCLSSSPCRTRRPRQPSAEGDERDSHEPQAHPLQRGEPKSDLDAVSP